MPSKHKLLPLFLLLLPLSLPAAIYVDVGASRLELSRTPEIGDVGARLSEDRPSSAFTLAVGYELTPRLALELRYTDLGDAHVYKLATTTALFPGEVGAAVPTYYNFDQSAALYSLALPVKVIAKGAFTLALTPLLHVERSDFTFTNAGVNTLLLPGPLPVLYRDKRTEVHFGGELKVSYRFNANVTASLSYNYSTLEAYDAHLVGAGLALHF